MKTHAEALSQWVSDEIEFVVGKCHTTFTRETFTKIVDAINRGQMQCRFHSNGAETVFSCDAWAELRAAILLRNKAITTAFLCRCDSFREAALVLNPPDTLLLAQKRAQEWHGQTTATDIESLCPKIG